MSSKETESTDWYGRTVEGQAVVLASWMVYNKSRFLGHVTARDRQEALKIAKKYHGEFCEVIHAGY